MLNGKLPEMMIIRSLTLLADQQLLNGEEVIPCRVLFIILVNSLFPHHLKNFSANK